MGRAKPDVRPTVAVSPSAKSGLVGISSPKFSRRRGELWFTNVIMFEIFDKYLAS